MRALILVGVLNFNILSTMPITFLIIFYFELPDNQLMLAFSLNIFCMFGYIFCLYLFKKTGNESLVSNLLVSILFIVIGIGTIIL